jgi:hypothetical protein
MAIFFLNIIFKVFMDKSQVSAIIKKVHETHWIRLLICVGPGILLTKLGTSFESLSILKMGGTVVLILGGLIYSFWHFAAKKISKNEDVPSEPVDQSPLTSGVVITFDHLVLICKGDFKKALRLVAIESELTPDISYPDAVKNAFNKRLKDSVDSDS